MNREIKFRAWLPCTSQMTHADTIEGIGKWAPLACTPVWLQYTGLKDKNNNEIYEGDIIKGAYNEYLYVVEFKRGEFICEKGIHILGKSLWDKTEIVGNIYEHAHLLAGNNDR